MYKFILAAGFTSLFVGSVASFAETSDKPSLRAVFDKKAIQEQGAELKRQVEDTLPRASSANSPPSFGAAAQGSSNDSDNSPWSSSQRKAEIENIESLSEVIKKEKEEASSLEKFDRVKIENSILYQNQDIRNVNIVYSAWLEIKKVKEQEEEQEFRMEGAAGDILSSILENLETKKKQAEGAEEVVVERDVTIYRIPAYYYLSSLIYRNPKNVSVWLNGEKFEEGKQAQGLELKATDKTTAYFEWEVNEIRANLEAWSKKAKRASKYSLAKIDVDPENRIVKFSLQANQLFDVQNMIITEGKRTEKLVTDLNDLFYDPAKPETRISIIRESSVTEEQDPDLISIDDLEDVFSQPEGQSDEEIIRQLRESGQIRGGGKGRKR